MALVTSRAYRSNNAMGFPRQPAMMRALTYGARLAGKGVGNYLKRKRSGGSQQSSKRRTGTAPTGLTTYQHDVKQTYRYKRAPKKLRKKWKKSRKRFTSNLLKTLSSKKYHYSGNLTMGTTQGKQAFYGLFTYGMNGTGGIDGSGDLEDLRQRLGAGIINQPDQASGVTAQFCTKYFFDTMAGRANLTNTGSNLAFIEIYTMRCRQDIPIDFATTFYQLVARSTGSPHQSSVTTAANSTLSTSATSSPDQTFVGVTPFQYRWLCQRFKIMNVKRLQLAAGNSISWSFEDTKNRCFVPDNQEQNLLAKRGWTTLYLFRIWGQTAVVSSTPTELPVSIVAEFEKDYNVKVMAAQTPELNYITYTNNSESS